MLWTGFHICYVMDRISYLLCYGQDFIFAMLWTGFHICYVMDRISYLLCYGQDFIFAMLWTGFHIFYEQKFMIPETIVINVDLKCYKKNYNLVSQYILHYFYIQ